MSERWQRLEAIYHDALGQPAADGAAADVGHNDHVGDSLNSQWTDEQRAWALHAEALWARARGIAQVHPDVDASDVYHALRCLELSPAERLRQGLSRGRLRAYSR